jgi:hypothetical protein
VVTPIDLFAFLQEWDMGRQRARKESQPVQKKQPAPTRTAGQSPETAVSASEAELPLTRQEAAALSTGQMLQLQRVIGNQAVGRLLSQRQGNGDTQPKEGPKGPGAAASKQNDVTPQPEGAEVAPAVQRSRNGKGHSPIRAKKAAVNQVQRRDTQHSIAKILNAGVSVRNERGNMGQLGHAMDIWVQIDAGTHPVTPANARPNTVYGLELEYWENVAVPHDNQGGVGVKPWNDIYGMKPDASTFDTAVAGCDLTWKQAVEQAAAGTLTGRKKIGFRDIPGLFERPGRNVERTLKFRIVFNDGANRQEIFATQLLRVNNGQLGYSAYVDSAGNSLEAHGFGGDTYEAGSVTEQGNITREGGRLNMGSLPSKAQIVAALPLEAKAAVQTFVAELVKGQATPYLDLEIAEFVQKVATDRQRAASSDWLDNFSKSLLGDVPGGVAAGQFLIPQIAGTQRFQTTLPSGGLLVALATGTNVLKMYYTDNTTKNISLDFIPQLATKHWTLNLRSFAEIPTETVQNSLDTFRALDAPSTLKKIPLNADDTHLRKFGQQGANYIVKANDMVGPKIKRGNEISLFDPEIRDISGEWLKAQFGRITGFVRASKLTGVKTKEKFTRDVKGALTATTGGGAMKLIFQKHFRDNGNGHVAYSQLVTNYPGLEGDITSTYRELFGEDQFNKMLLDRETAGRGGDIVILQFFAQLDDGDHPEMIKDVMAYLKARPGQGDAIESVYNQHVATAGYNVPATLGEIAHAHFMKTFRDQGDAFTIYNQLLTDFPDFGYRLKPAYRLVHGEDRLQQMLQERQAAEFAVDVPEPDSVDNILDYLNFVTHDPFTVNNFVPTAGVGNAKFDAAYDPGSGKLDIIVKVYYRFADSPFEPIDVSGEAPGFNQGFGRKTWTVPEQINWKQSYVTATAGVFNASGRKIKCIRPGWNNIEVTPEFHVQEVPQGQQHFVIDATKAVLTNPPEGKKLQGVQAGAGSTKIGGVNVASVMLSEYDVYDKFKDPRLHDYLHVGETRQHVGPAYEQDRKRLEDVLGQLGGIEFSGSSTAIRDKIRNLSDALKRLEIPSSLASLHPIVVKGVANEIGNMAARRAAYVKNCLEQAGVNNHIEVATTAGAPGGVVVSAQAPDPAVKDTYVTNWSRFTAAHEFGHQLGLIDEYYGAASGETVKQMISAGLLPPETRSDHLKLHPPKGMVAQQKDKQEATMRLLKRTGLESPDFTMQTPGNELPKSTSLMSSGFDVTKVHMITVWEALAAMTRTHLDEKFWRIS